MRISDWSSYLCSSDLIAVMGTPQRRVHGHDPRSVEDMTPATLLTDSFERIHESGLAVLDGLSEDQLAHRPGPGANSIAWLIWHLTRVQDDHVDDAAGLERQRKRLNSSH